MYCHDNDCINQKHIVAGLSIIVDRSLDRSAIKSDSAIIGNPGTSKAKINMVDIQMFLELLNYLRDLEVVHSAAKTKFHL